MKNKALTIVVPSYNMEKFLAKCLDSLIVDPADMERLEVLIVNDGSKDRTSVIAHEYEANYPLTFRVIDKENGNYGSCVERGLSEARGVYIKTLDADDWFDRDNFEKYLRFICEKIDSGDAPDLILNDFDFVGLDGVPYKHMSYAFCEEPGFTVAGFTYENDRAMWMHAAAYKTENLRRIGYTQMHGISYTDEEWISLPMTTVNSIAYYPGVVYKYLMGRDGQTCGWNEYLKGFWMQMVILRKLISQYESRRGEWGPEQEKYMLNHLSYRLALTYRICLSEKPNLKSESLESFDAFLKKESPGLYEISSQLLYSKKFPIRFIGMWRKSRFLCVALVNTYMLLRRMK